MIRALAVGFGIAIAFGTAMYACGGDDTTTGGGAGTSNGTAGATSGAAGATSGTAGTASATGGSAGSASGAGGAVSGAGGAVGFDGSFDLDALAGLIGNYTCADLAACCATLASNMAGACTTVVNEKSDPTCSLTLTGLKQGGYCK